MMQRWIVDLAIAGVGLCMLAVGLAWKDPALSAIVVGGVLYVTVIGVRVLAFVKKGG